jgi:putative transposase
LIIQEFYIGPIDKSNDYRRGRHGVFALHAHLVFVTKYRRKVFTAAILDDAQTIFSAVCLDFKVPLVEMDGEDDLCICL